MPFSYLTEKFNQPQVSCFITYTNENTHRIIRENFHKSTSSYLNDVVAPRYCPSIEAKVKKFAEKSSHQIFLEPEGLEDNAIYPNGISNFWNSWYAGHNPAMPSGIPRCPEFAFCTASIDKKRMAFAIDSRGR